MTWCKISYIACGKCEPGSEDIVVFAAFSGSPQVCHQNIKQSAAPPRILTERIFTSMSLPVYFVHARIGL